MWIYERKNWPHFTWDADVLASKLSDVRYRQGLLLGKMSSLGFELKAEATVNILTKDVLKSSAIEGEILNPEEVRSSVATQLGIKMAGMVKRSQEVDGVVTMLLDATQNYQNPLTVKRLLSWHNSLFPTGYSGLHKITVGKWRPLKGGAMQVVSGPIGREKVHFEAPHASLVPKEMLQFLKWFESNEPLDPVLKAGIAHLWFVTIHPFSDGNGRIGRAIADMTLARADGTSDRFYSMSASIESDRKNYYDQLERQQKGGLDITPWLSWFLTCLGNAISRAEKSLASVLYKADFWRFANDKRLNTRQHHVITRMLDEDFVGYMNNAKYAKLAKCSQDTALRDMKALVKAKVFVRNPGAGRSTSYRLTSQEELNRK